MVKLTKEQEELFDKIKNAKCLMNGLFEILEKSFDSIFEIEWSVLELELDIKKDSKEEKKEKKPRVARKKKIENEIVIPPSDDE
jgi:hypothetical protein